MAMKRVYKTGIVVFGFLLLFGVIGWYYFFYRPRLYQVGEKISVGEPYPYLSQVRFRIGEDDPWEMGNFQPVVKDFLRKDGANYIIGEYEDGAGNVYNAKIFVTGKIDEENYVESIYYYQSEDNQSLLSFDRLKQEIKPGSRIRVEYLSVIPSKDKQECDLDPLSCQIAIVARGSLEKLKNYEENSIGSQDVVFGALTIFSEIYEE